MKGVHKKVSDAIASAPEKPGIYLFKDVHGKVVYIGKAKKIRTRVRSYLAGFEKEWKSTTILRSSCSVEFVVTRNELEALLLEAKLIQSYQPPCNVLLKTGQPYVYFLITKPQKGDVPRFEFVRNKRAKGTYFGPFIDKTTARRVFAYLQETFQVQTCKKAIPGGCLAYHMGRCAGTCRDDFDSASYRERLSLIARALRKDRAQVSRGIEAQIEHAIESCAFERAQQLEKYKEAFATVYDTLRVSFDRSTSLKRLAHKDIWVWQSDAFTTTLALYRQTDGIVSKHRVFCFRADRGAVHEAVQEYVLSFYRSFLPSQQIFFDTQGESEFFDPELIGTFCEQWHEVAHAITVHTPALESEELALARVQLQKEVARRAYVGRDLKRILQLPVVPRTIDCFDISHKQGYAMVGSCVRFKDGDPDKSAYRHFHIKTLDGQNDFAALQEIVQRRYRSHDDLPDLIVIDGGKGQLSSVRAVIDHMLMGTKTRLVSLAKREETVYSDLFPDGKVLDQRSMAGQTLIALRDYAHHAAITFHRKTYEKTVS